MKQEKFNAIVEAINIEIKYAVYEFNNNGSSEFYNRLYSRICGMIEVLRIATDDNYYFDENGLHYENGKIVEPQDKNAKHVLQIDGYTLEPATIGCHSIQVMTTDNCVVDFTDLNRAEYPVLLHAFESDDSVEKIVVADFYGAFIYGENNLIREGDAEKAAETDAPAQESEPAIEPEPKAQEPAQESTTGLYSVTARFRNARRNSRRPYDRRGIVWANSRDEAIARFVKSYNGTVPENVIVDALFWGDIVYTL